ncbi:MAG TPA: sugar phosphate isomerase/epimerase [Casimicrobiaceae bacterium]|jgi:sugar phosphate isomerase/epimerase
MIPLSLSYHTAPELTPPEFVREAAAAGFDSVGARLLDGQPGRDLAPLMQNAAVRRETIACLRDTGLRVLEASSARLRPDTDMSAFAPFFELAAELGARHILASGDDPDQARLVARFAELCERARPLGLTIDLEFVPWMSVTDLGAAARIVRAVGQANFGIAVDALHFDRSHSRLAELAKLPRGWFRFVQLCDAPAAWTSDRDALIHAAVSERLFPGEGAIDLVGLLQALPRELPIALEIPTSTLARTIPAAERLRRAVAATRTVLAKAYG